MELTTADIRYPLLQRESLKSKKKMLILSKESLKSRNKRLNNKISMHLKLSKILTKSLDDMKDKNAKLTEKFNVALLEDKDYQCPVCHEPFIEPALLNCSHMFCTWCLENCLKENNHCPLCRVPMTHAVHCLSMKNFIEKRMELMPATIRLERKNLEEGRRAKHIFKQSQEEIFQLYLRYSSDASQSSNN
ncbi:E3 ubiquitin-protein ligase RNF8-like isoform X2 [Myzus persicae]|uniref:E3 ubiquitin-protein ligase RNF8-like isoform X2 n=1 Tax=Myzus persicae TaxID=13164 RepID=UPI000B9377D0|nr:E3 ubiquitin-protein ligase RNF8-like isoform X2 [Myzus persicae]XP_022161309.1 E3 ubiquitin-protein ligase RNF8-like isoform X2 [Myzus persicae]XP_022161311.1 E3 ubiquitin-protein ligase RNF8-like isoform X2 [Myzus persicae]XP_022161312.1 E3 ubiquitin-protein ligase RNF8-like isoform X2 [Myzus persicae]